MTQFDCRYAGRTSYIIDIGNYTILASETGSMHHYY